MATTADPVSSSELAAFVAAYEAGTVQGAADALSLTQSAVTKRLQMLERKLGATVFARGRLGVTPTQLGQTIYPPAKQALAHLQTVALAAQAVQADRRQQLRISASLTIGEFLLPSWLTSFRAGHPEIHPQLEVVNSANVLSAVRDGRSAIGFIENGSPPPDLESLVVAHDQLVVVTATHHRWARRRSLSASTLAQEAYFTREQDSGTRAVATTALAAHGIELTPELEVTSTQSLKRMITQEGFAILSTLTIIEEQRAGLLTALPVRDLELSRDLHAVRRPPRPTKPQDQSPAARSFWTWLTTQRPVSTPATRPPTTPLHPPLS